MEKVTEKVINYHKLTLEDCKRMEHEKRNFKIHSDERPEYEESPCQKSTKKFCV
jgi:hypothetical protein